jgi:ABC-type Na+ transport system ATPase subunit NatA
MTSPSPIAMAIAQAILEDPQIQVLHFPASGDASEAQPWQLAEIIDRVLQSTTHG